MSLQKTDSESYLMTMEAGEDTTGFLNWSAVREEYDGLEGAYAMRLNASENKVVGLFKELEVLVGKSLTISVLYGKNWYRDERADIPEHIMIDPSFVEGQGSGDLHPVKVLYGQSHHNWTYYTDAYLMLLYFDSAGHLILGHSQAYLVSTHGKGWRRGRYRVNEAFIESIVPEGAVKAWVYVANEVEQDVYFDDFKITYSKTFPDRTFIVQEHSYYPFGMTMASLERLGSPNHPFQFNGIEKTETFGLNISHALYRSLDPTLGRWWQVDPEAEHDFSGSVYNGFYNNPLTFSDPNGDCPICAAIAIGAFANVLFQGASGNINSTGQFFGALAIGAAAGAAGYGAGFSGCWFDRCCNVDRGYQCGRLSSRGFSWGC